MKPLYIILIDQKPCRFEQDTRGLTFDFVSRLEADTFELDKADFQAEIARRNGLKSEVSPLTASEIILLMQARLKPEEPPVQGSVRFVVLVDGSPVHFTNIPTRWTIEPVSLEEADTFPSVAVAQSPAAVARARGRKVEYQELTVEEAAASRPKQDPPPPATGSGKFIILIDGHPAHFTDDHFNFSFEKVLRTAADVFPYDPNLLATRTCLARARGHKVETSELSIKEAEQSKPKTHPPKPLPDRDVFAAIPNMRPKNPRPPPAHGQPQQNAPGLSAKSGRLPSCETSALA